MVEDETKYKSKEEADAAEEFNQREEELQEAARPLIIDIPSVGAFESEESISSDDYQRVLTQLQTEVAEAVQNGVFSRGNTPGFHYEIEGKHFNFRKAGGIRITDQTTGATYDSFKDHEQTTGVHEKAHGDFGIRFSKLVGTGEDRQFVQDVVRRLGESNIWDQAAKVVVTGWPLSALGVNNSKLQSSLDESVRGGSFDVRSFLSLAQRELSDDDYFLLQKGILNEINSIAAEGKNKSIPKILREVFAKTSAGQNDLPVEV